MKKIVGFAILFCLCLPLSIPAADYDMAEVTCADMMKDNESMTLMYFWLDGYMSAKMDNTMLRQEEVESNINIIRKECEGNPRKKIFSLLE